MASTSKWAAASERDSLLYNQNQTQNNINESDKIGGRYGSGYSQLAGSNNRHHRNVYDGFRRPSIRRIIRDYPKPVPIKWTKTLSKTGLSFTIIMGLVFALLIVFKVWFNLSTSTTCVIPIKPPELTSKLSNINDHSQLISVNVLFRHGDRAPEHLDHLGMQQLQPLVRRIWPHGLGNLTDVGRFRMFKVGQELSRLYRFPLSAYDTDNLYAFSSNFPRCIESMQTVLRGYFNPEATTLETALEELIAVEEHCKRNEPLNEQPQFCSLLANSSTNDFETDQWKRVEIDFKTLVQLRSKYVIGNCPKFNVTNCSIYNNLTYDRRLTSLPGFKELQGHISSNSTYQQAFNYELTNFYGSLNPIIKSSSIPVVRTALAPHIKWIAQPVEPTRSNSRNLTLLNTYETLNMMADAICTNTTSDHGVNAENLQISPILTQIVRNQVAIDSNVIPYGNSNHIVLGKKFILYAAHDTIIESLLNQLEIRVRIADGISFSTQNFHANNEINGELNNLLNGLKRPEPGASVAFELWKTRPAQDLGLKQPRFTFVRLLIYQREDAIHQRVQFEGVQFGSICNKLFLKLHENDAGELEKFYTDAPHGFDRDFNCPFQLWKNITSSMMMSQDQFETICHG